MGGTRGELLCLDGLAAVDRHDHQVFVASSLITVDVFRNRVQATYAPRGWSGLQVRASWGPDPAGLGMDLEVQVTAFSVGELRSVEVLVGSGLEPSATTSTCRFVQIQPRDRRAAVLSYDGREPLEVLHRLRTEPIPALGTSSIGPAAIASWRQDQGATFLEMAHPDDVARRMLWFDSDHQEADAQVLSVRNGLFGYDLEKGVVLRGRLRGLWLKDDRIHLGAAESEFQRFLDQPPPLGM